MQRKPSGQSGRGCDNGDRRVVTVDVPLPYEGIGNALRASFRPIQNTLPSDMLELLNQLDR